jgi:hypothetical protein
MVVESFPVLPVISLLPGDSAVTTIRRDHDRKETAHHTQKPPPGGLALTCEQAVYHSWSALILPAYSGLSLVLATGWQQLAWIGGSLGAVRLNPEYGPLI